MPLVMLKGWSATLLPGPGPWPRWKTICARACRPGRKFPEVTPETMREESKFETEFHFTQEDEAFLLVLARPCKS